MYIHRRWCAWLLVIATGCTFAAEPPSRIPPDIYTTHLAPLLTPLAEVLQRRDAFPDASTNGIVLLDEVVHYRDDTGIGYVVFHDVYLARNAAAERVMASRIYSFDREHDSIFLVSAATIGADGTRHELGERAAFLQSPQREADAGLYTSEQELNIVFPNIAPGAVTQSIVVIRQNTSVFPGEFASSYAFARGWPVAKFRFVADFPTAFMERIHTVKSTPQAPDPVEERIVARTRRTWTRELVKEIDWEESGPALRFRAPSIWLSTLDSWDQVSAWFTELAASRAELGSELEERLAGWTAGVTERRALVDRLAGVVANEVRYTGLEFGLAGFQPYPCERVWANRYGDCKDKANLLRALLARQGITSHFLLLEAGGLGRVERRSPSWKQFNHVILAVDDGEGGHWFLDTTMRHLPPDHLPMGDAARDALLLRDGRAEWLRLPDPLDNAIHVDADLSLAPDGELTGWFTLRARAGDAASYTNSYNRLKPADRRRTLERTVQEFYPGAEVIDVDYEPADGPVTDFTIRAYLLRKPSSNNQNSVAFGYPRSWLPSLSLKKRLFPYRTIRRIESFKARIALPVGWNGAELPDPVRIDSAAVTATAAWEAHPDRLEQSLSWAPKAAELSAADYAVFERTMRTLHTWLGSPVRVAPTEFAASSPAPKAPDFPLLPTGAGQLRLLDERFPQGERDQERRAALRQVQQWFPDDADTVFTAKVYLALIDHAEAAARSRALTAAINEHATNIPIESLAWGRYMRARADWDATKDPSAPHELEALAADTSLTLFRRSWSALYAARMRAETDLRAALALLAPWDIPPSDARDQILTTKVRWLARLGDPAAIAAWIQHLLHSGADADELLAVALADLGTGKDPQSDTALHAFHRAAAPLLTPAQDFPRTAPHLARLRDTSAQVERREQFTARLEAWLKEHPRTWLTPGKVTQFADLASLEKHLAASNDARDAEATIDGVFQLVRFHACDYDTFAKYLFWAAWWLEKRGLDLEMLRMLAEETRELPSDTKGNIGEIWFKYASAARAAGQIDAARAELRGIPQIPGVRPYQRLEANGELALLELAAGRLDAARAAFAACDEDHATHRQGSHYLFMAALLALQDRDWDRALGLTVKIGATQREYRDESAYADAMSYLLACSAHPEAIRRYWEIAASARNQWDRLLERHGLSPTAAHQLPLLTDINVLQQEIAAAAQARDTSAYLRKVDVLVRLSFCVPVYLLNACNQFAKASALDDQLQQDLYAFALPLTQAYPQANDKFYWSARLWEAALFIDIKPPRLATAAASAKTLFQAEGPEIGLKAGALRLWLNATAATNDHEAIDAAVALLASDVALPDRAALVESLSNTLGIRKEHSAHVQLLTREVASPAVAANASAHARLKSRLTSLKREASQGAEFTLALNGWLDANNLGFIRHMPPHALVGPRYGTTGSAGIYEESSLSSGEAAKCNWLLALDETKAMHHRHQAFIEFHDAIASREPHVDRYIALASTAVNLGPLPTDIAFKLGSRRLAFLLRNGQPDAANTFLKSLSNPVLRDDLRRLYQRAFAVAHALDDYSPARAREAFAGMLAKPIDAYDLAFLRTLLSRITCAGDDKLAADLVASARNLEPLPMLGQSANSIQLDLLRHVRREARQLPLYHHVSDALAAVAVPTAVDRSAARRLTSPASLGRIFDHATRKRVIAAILADHLFLETNRALLLDELGSASAQSSFSATVGPRIEHLILTATDLDDQTLAQWLATVQLADFDLPAVRQQLTRDLEACLARPEVRTGAVAARTIRFRLALIALRTSEEAQPDALFGVPFGHAVPPSIRHGFQLAFLTSRGDLAAARSLASAMDAGSLSGPECFPYVRIIWDSADHADEMKLLTDAAVEQFAASLPDLWLEPSAPRLVRAARTARSLDVAGLLTDEFFSHALELFADDFDRQIVLLARAIRDRNWKVQMQVADHLLKLSPEHYDLVYLRGEALHELGAPEDARPDLELFLLRALESPFRPDAERMLNACRKSSERAE